MKKLLLLAVALVGSVVAKADTYTVSDVNMISGSTGVITVGLTNAADVRDFQVKVAIPAGFTYVSSALTGRAASNYTLDTDAVANTTTNAAATFIGYSTGNGGNACYLTAGNGDILTITVSTAANAWAEGNNAANTTDGAVTNDAAAASVVTLPAFNLLAGILGDVDRSAGVDIADASSIIGYYNNGSVSGTFYLQVADVFADSVIDIADFSGAIGIYNSAVKAEVNIEEPVADEDVIWAE
ncbi:MAG: hypothetical protein J6Y39_00660 [Bacteroidaceae bacterium]|nr:hypothetical protein [Bacteroidaceae bacterium]